MSGAAGRAPAASELRSAAVVVVNPSGNRSRVLLDPLPFTIGRHPDNHLVLRDNRVSRHHARILQSGAEYFVEDLGSRHGVLVNGERVARQRLENGDRIDFGVGESYHLLFSIEEAEIQRILDQFSMPAAGTPTPGGENLAKLRALVEVARALQSSLSTNDVLAAVVDATLTVTGAERGFLLLREGEGLQVRVARDRRGLPLAAGDLRVPTRIIARALNQRRELLSMNFDPLGVEGIQPDLSVASLELRSVVCVPLVRVRATLSEDTCLSSPASETVGLLYMDSRFDAADLSSGNRELLQTLALEASTILENARLLEGERAKLRLEKELSVAREIQASLLPKHLPAGGWFRAAGSSIPSHQVGGDSFDIRQLHPGAWSVLVTDVSGKGVSSALLTSLLQGAFVMASESGLDMAEIAGRINRFLIERTEGEKYATLFYGVFEAGGRMRYINAGHCPPFLLRGGELTGLAATGMPVGLLEQASYEPEELQLEPGDKIAIYSDGVSEAEDVPGGFFGLRRMKDSILTHAGEDCGSIHDALMRSVEDFTTGALQNDDITLVVLEYAPPVQ
ncbi:MAG: SpoIIE family protein phosphatase [Acidobacteria bacterium]|nr:SpoIIE family protein phosphatase [Acidobacteriota bacterium]